MKKYLWLPMILAVRALWHWLSRSSPEGRRRSRRRDGRPRSRRLRPRSRRLRPRCRSRRLRLWFRRRFGYGIGFGFYGGYLYDPFWYGPGYGYYFANGRDRRPGRDGRRANGAHAGSRGGAAERPDQGAAPRCQCPRLVRWQSDHPHRHRGRIYHTPDLTAGSTPTYRIRAAWTVNGKEVVQEQVVPVAPGRGSVADFTRPYSEALPPPPGKE